MPGTSSGSTEIQPSHMSSSLSVGVSSEVTSTATHTSRTSSLRSATSATNPATISTTATHASHTSSSPSHDTSTASEISTSSTSASSDLSGSTGTTINAGHSTMSTESSSSITTATAISPGSTETSTSASSAPMPTYTPLGCFAEPAAHSFDQLALANYSSGTLSDLTVQSCVDICVGLNLPFSGLEFGSMCLCSDGIYHGGKPAPNAACDARCTGNLTETDCGSLGHAMRTLRLPTRMDGCCDRVTYLAVLPYPRDLLDMSAASFAILRAHGFYFSRIPRQFL
ncbi:hypothetical protein CALCODRAFT_243668 [Calocera cornea HHB12733]|uniref:WSC domain-containing protein n=1 Tax=Calocera cornea HHB12733 TaxID=1353952 RepID=A0A165GQN0_9BASI|nr:hypothetical protein CALCODRAFT_243668 [Calocera cornea HHB12733]